MTQLLNILFGTAQVLIGGVFDFILLIFSKKTKPVYTAKFGEPFNQGISRFNHGFAITGNKALTKHASHTNAAIFGPTGSGKSSVAIINSAFSIARGKSTLIFNDVSGEVFFHTSGYLEKQGYKILRLDFSNSSNSETFNPLADCKTISDIQKVALLIVRNAIESKSDPFWEQSAVMLISLFCRYLVFHTGEQYWTMQNVLRLIEKFSVDGHAIDTLMVKANDEELMSAYKATIVVGDKTLQSIIATARAALNLFCDVEVCKTTQANSIDFNMLRNEPVALYVCNPLQDLQYFKPLSALFFQSLFNKVLSRIPGKQERSIFFILDEAATMRFPSLSLTVSNIRKFSAGILLCMQDEMALIAQYGQAEAHQIKTNCGCQVYMKGQPLHTCKELSQLLGKYTYTDERGHDKVRELLTADEIHLLEEAIILIGNYEPLKCKMVPHFENIWVRAKTQIPPYIVHKKQASSPPVIQFE